MTDMRKTVQVLLPVLLMLLSSNMPAAGKRVYVFQLPQQYWDVVKGDSLSAIAAKLLPAEPDKHHALMQAIYVMNPNAFIGGNRDRLRSDIRLWLPGSGLQTHGRHSSTPEDTSTTDFSWGNIKKQRP
jgi:hypothetical protein